MKRLLLTLVVLAVAAPASSSGVLPFVENDFAAALAQARARNLPLFVEAWAPW